jgi:hypothetical protein
MLGVTALADASRYQLDTASLLTHVDDGTPAAFTSAAGRTFVAPTNASMLAATKLLKADPASNTWPIPYDALRASAPAAYPGTTVIYAAVATKGLSKTDASDYSRLIDYLSTTGQRQGSGNGELPPGYLPLTSANGLGALASYAQTAAKAVAAQKGSVPSVDGKTSSASSGGTGSSPAGGSSKGGSTPPSAGSAGGAKAAQGTATLNLQTVGATQSLSSSVGSVALPVLLGLALVGGLLAPVGSYVYRLRRRP